MRLWGLAMYSSIVPAYSTLTSKWLDFGVLAICLGYLASASMSHANVGEAEWFPDRPDQQAYEWHYKPCPDCVPLEVPRDWQRMQRLAGLETVHYLKAKSDKMGDAYSFAPNGLVLSEAALRLPRCQLDFVVGHELVHLAMHDYDEDANSVAVLSGMKPSWTHNGKQALSLLSGDYALAIKMASVWQGQERWADWVGALLAAEGAGCTLQVGALPYLDAKAGYGGGIGAAHEADAVRARFLAGFSEPVARLAARW